jgi:hypothetical protein
MSNYNDYTSDQWASADAAQVPANWSGTATAWSIRVRNEQSKTRAQRSAEARWQPVAKPKAAADAAAARRRIEERDARLDKEAEDFVQHILDESDAADARAEEAKQRARATRAGHDPSVGSNPVPKVTVREGVTYFPGGPDYVSDLIHRAVGRYSMTPPSAGGGQAGAAEERLHRWETVDVPDLIRRDRGAYEFYRSQAIEAYRGQHLTPNDHSARLLRSWTFPEARDTDAGGLATPQYLTADFARFFTAASPVASQARQESLPASGLQVSVPKLQSGFDVEIQTAENDAIASSSATSTFDTAPVDTFAGQQTVSYQALERSEINLSAVLSETAARQAATAADVRALQVLLQSGAVHQQVNSGSASVAALASELGKAATWIETQSGNQLAPTHAFIASPAMRFFEAQVGSDGLPSFSRPQAQAGNATSGTVGTPLEGSTGVDWLGMGLWREMNLSAASAGWDGGIVAALPQSLIVYSGPPVLDVHIEYAPQQLSAIVVWRRYMSFALIRNSVVALTGSMWGNAVIA